MWDRKVKRLSGSNKWTIDHTASGGMIATPAPTKAQHGVITSWSSLDKPHQCAMNVTNLKRFDTGGAGHRISMGIPTGEPVPSVDFAPLGCV